MTPTEMDQKIEEHFHFEENDDIDGVLQTLAPDIVHDIIGSPTGPTVGRDAARKFYESLFGEIGEGTSTCLKRLYGENFLIDESEWDGKAIGRPFGLEGRNRPLKFRLLHVMEFTEDKQIAREQVWMDMGAVMQQLPQD